MKLRSILPYACAAIILVSCQKGYSPDGLVAPGTNPSGVLKLTKAVSKTRGSSESSAVTFDYNASGKVIKMTRVETDSANVSTTIVYRYVRDAQERVTRIITNVLSAGTPGGGLPDSLAIDVHYPSSASVNFDYTVYRFTYAGVVFADSTVFAYTGNTITGIAQYQAVATTTYSLASNMQYTYANGNISAATVAIPPSNGSPALSANYTFQYDDKNQALPLGNDAFLVGFDASYYCRNNIKQLVSTDNASGSSQSVTLTYTYQYNTANYPVSGTITASTGNGTSDLSFTYQ